MKDFVFQDILFEFEEVSSTNTIAKEMILKGEGGRCFAILAKKQTSGRGRLARSWSSEANGNIYFTLSFHRSLAGNFGCIMPLFTSFALIEVIGEKARYKWANDVLIQGKKVAGILVESVGDFFVVGIGVNVMEAPAETLFPATSLKENGLFLTPKDIFESFSKNLDLSPDFVRNALKQKFFTRDKISINQGEFEGIMEDITKDGNLILRQNDGRLKEISFGDVGV
jgi:BirA family biotin operon repressor/biotin-[acetyl-CoA-carboxylase] ligase